MVTFGFEFSPMVMEQDVKALTPLIKQSLKDKIRSRRQSEGIEEIKVLFEQPKQYPLTPEEQIKNEIRRARNRRSANKSRLKRQCHEKALKKEIEALEAEHTKLIADVNALTKFKQSMDNKFQSHLKSCQSNRTQRGTQHNSDQYRGLQTTDRQLVNHSNGQLFQQQQIQKQQQKQPGETVTQTNEYINKKPRYCLNVNQETEQSLWSCQNTPAIAGMQGCTGYLSANTSDACIERTHREFKLPESIHSIPREQGLDILETYLKDEHFKPLVNYITKKTTD